MLAEEVAGLKEVDTPPPSTKKKKAHYWTTPARRVVAGEKARARSQTRDTRTCSG